MAAAISAAEADASNTVTIFEASDRIGRSILASGNGRCNFSNSTISASAYHNASFVSKTFESLPSQKVLETFSRWGMIWREENEGRLYPASNRATTVLDLLRLRLEEVGVTVHCDTEVLSITPAGSKILVRTKSDLLQSFNQVILATGRLSTQSLLPPTYRYINTEPLLGPLKTETACIKGLDNIRVRCRVSGGLHCEEGELLFRKYGVSGIVIFNISRHITKGDHIFINFMPQYETSELETLLESLLALYPERTALQHFIGMLNKKVAETILKRANIIPDKTLSRKQLPELIQMLTSFSLKVEGIADFQQCQVTRGGFELKHVDPQTMQSIHDEGIYFAGEALDVDGPCGGYNLHWAWASGIMAGRHAGSVRV